jgi:predicted enzyme related to lactoylglutathione lyase
VTHYSKLAMIVMDVPADENEAEIAFWQAATGRPLREIKKYPEYHGGMLADGHMGLLVQRLEDGPAHIHVDIKTDDMAAEVARLEALGAERVREFDSWFVMRDPAGLVFCVVSENPGSLNDGNATRWD